jgi:hypothetical protein
MKFNVGDRVLITATDYGLSYFNGTIQRINSFDGMHYYFGEVYDWAFLPKHAIPVTPLIEALE